MSLSIAYALVGQLYADGWIAEVRWNKESRSYMVCVIGKKDDM